MSGKPIQEANWAVLDKEAGTTQLSDEEKVELKKKNLAVAAALTVFVALVFLVTMAKLATNFGA